MSAEISGKLFIVPADLLAMSFLLIINSFSYSQPNY